MAVALAQVAPMNPYKKIFCIRSRPHNTIMTCRTADTRDYYAIGFICKDAAMTVQTGICPRSRIEFVDLKKGGETSIIAVEKKIDINSLPCTVQTVTFEDFMMMPLVHNLGVAFVYNVAMNKETEYLMHAITFDSITDLKSFKMPDVMID
jgi:hypothetical protein